MVGQAHLQDANARFQVLDSKMAIRSSAEAQHNIDQLTRQVEALERKTGQLQANAKPAGSPDNDFTMISSAAWGGTADEAEKIARRFGSTIPSAARLGLQQHSGAAASAPFLASSSFGMPRCVIFDPTFRLLEARFCISGSKFSAWSGQD